MISYQNAKFSEHCTSADPALQKTHEMPGLQGMQCTIWRTEKTEETCFFFFFLINNKRTVMKYLFITYKGGEDNSPHIPTKKRKGSRDFPVSHLHLLTQENTETHPAVLLAFSNNGFDKTLHQFPSHFPHGFLANRVNAQHQNGGEERIQRSCFLQQRQIQDQVKKYTLNSKMTRILISLSKLITGEQSVGHLFCRQKLGEHK